MNLASLKRLAAVWQERLKLIDWDITIRWAKPGDLDDDDFGQCETYKETRRAEIIMRHPSKYTDKDKANKTVDLEVFVVHELMHLHYAVFATEPGSALEVAEENTVSVISRLLIAIDRRDDEITGRKLSRRASLTPRKPIAKKIESNKVLPQEAKGEASTTSTVTQGAGEGR